MDPILDSVYPVSSCKEFGIGSVNSARVSEIEEELGWLKEQLLILSGLLANLCGRG